MIELLPGIVLTLLAVVWWAASCSLILDVLRVPPLPRSRRPGGAASPRVTVVIAARDEAARIETTLTRLLAQREVDLEIVVVDDRSDDATPTVLRDLAERESRLRVIRVDTLPDGWLGKPHACHVGAAEASGDWLLFTDADAWPDEDVVARSVAAAVDAGADHVCLFPGESETTFLGRAALLSFSLGMIKYAARANRDHRRSFIGVGAFNLVRTEAYRAIGGHEPLRFEVIDDLKLGLLLRRAGFRSRAYAASRDLVVQWASSGPDLVRALEKNYFAVLGFRFGRALAVVTLMVLLLGSSLLGPLFSLPAGWAAFAGMLSITVPAALVARRAGWSPLPALLTPLMSWFLVLAIANSAVAAWRRGGIDWRGTFYPLDELRRGTIPMRLL